MNIRYNCTKYKYITRRISDLLNLKMQIAIPVLNLRDSPYKKYILEHTAMVLHHHGTGLANVIFSHICDSKLENVTDKIVTRTRLLLFLLLFVYFYF